MIPAAVVLLAAAAAPLLCPSRASLVASTETIANLSCPSHDLEFYVEADYRIWRTVTLRTNALVHTSTSDWQCNVRVNMSTGPGQPLSGRPARLMLIKMETLLLSEDTETHFLEFGPRIPFMLRMDSPSNVRRPTYMLAKNAVDVIMSANFARNVVDLAMFVDFILTPHSLILPLPYLCEVSFVATEVTNVCDLASNTGELLVGSRNSSEYAFAPDRNLLPHSVACTRDLEYSLTLRPHVASAYLSVTALACPWNVSCSTLLLNGLSCREGETLLGAQPGCSVKLQYTHSSNCSKYVDLFAGFLVSAEIHTSAGPPIPSHRSFSQSNACALVTAVVGTLSAAALLIGIGLAL